MRTIWCCCSGFLQLLPERSSQYQNMAPSNTERESNWDLWKDEMNQKSFSSFFSEMTKPSLLLHSFSPHLINIPAWAQKMWILHVKPNFKENKPLRNFTIHHKLPKNTQENSQSLKTICFSPRSWQKHLPHLCSSLDAILYSQLHGNFSSFQQRRAQAVQG